MTKVDIASLYQGIIVNHAKEPLNYGKLDSFSHCFEGYNALCGDKILVYLKVKDSRIEEMKFESAACAICNASASMLSERIKGLLIEDWESFFDDFRRFIASPHNPQSSTSSLGKSLESFKALKNFPGRKQCALLPWKTLENALSNEV